MYTQYLILFSYFAILFGIGVLASRRIKNVGDYYVAGKKLGYWVAAFSARATGESGWLLLGLTGLGALVGLSAMWVVVGELLGVTIAWFLMAKPFRKAVDKSDAMTIPDYLAARFTHSTDNKTWQNKFIRLLSALTIALFVTVYVSAQIDATGKAFESFLGWNYYLGILVGFGIVIIYTYSGGFFAVAWSDLLQGSLMLVGLVLLPVAAWISSSGIAEIWQSLHAADPGLTNIWGPTGLTLASFMVAISYAAIGLGFLGSPQIFVRFISIKDQDEIDKGRWVAVIFTLLTDGGAVLAGMFGRYLLVDPSVDVVMALGPGAERLLPELVVYLFPSIVVAIFVAVVLAAIMSTVDSLLVVASSAVARDIYQQLLVPGIQDSQLTKLSKKVTLSLAMGALLIASVVSIISPDRTVFWFAIFGWSGIAATFCPVVLLSLFWRSYNFWGAVTSMITGFICVPFFKFVIPQLGDFGRSLAMAGELAPAFFISLLSGIIISSIINIRIKADNRAG